MRKFGNKRKIALGFIGLLGLTPLFLLSACSSQPPSQTAFTSTIDGKSYKYIGGRLSLIDSEGNIAPAPTHDKKAPKEYYSYLFSSILSTPLLNFIDQFASYQSTQPSTIYHGDPKTPKQSEYVYTRASEELAIFSNPLNAGSSSISLKMSNVNFSYKGIEQILPEGGIAPKPDPENDTSFKVSMSISGSVEFGFWSTFNKATNVELANSNYLHAWAPFYPGKPPAPSTTPVNLNMPFSVTSEINIINKLVSTTESTTGFKYTGEANLATQNESPKFDTTTQKYFDALVNVIAQRRISAAAFNAAVTLL